MKSFSLLKQASQFYDQNPAAFSSVDFKIGAEWMRECLETLRGREISRKLVSWNYYGVCKYLSCLLIALLVSCLFTDYGFIIQFLIFACTFYLLEAQSVFLFPLLIDTGEDRIWYRSFNMTLKAGGTIYVASVVVQIALFMIFGGFFFKKLSSANFVRAWCIGCVAILIWYEEIRC